jgi:probable FeS assembly SUF system protein SufT
MKTVYDPEIPINVVDLGLIYDCGISKLPDGSRYVYIQMTLTAPGCGMGEILVQDVRDKVGIIPTVSKVDVELVLDPPWNQTMMSESAQLEAGLL